MKGRIRYPKGRYVSLSCGNGSVSCEDVFDAVVVFEHGEWGGGDDNPLPLKRQRSSGDEDSKGSVDD